MSDKKRIDLQKHVSPKVSRRYLIRIFIYIGVIAGFILLMYYLQDRESTRGPSSTEKEKDEIQLQDFEIIDSVLPAE